MAIEQHVWTALDGIEKGLCTDPEVALSGWIDFPDDLEDARHVILYLNQILAPIAGHENEKELRDIPAHHALIDLVANSPIGELVVYDQDQNKMTLSKDVSESDLQKIQAVIRKYSVAFH